MPTGRRGVVGAVREMSMSASTSVLLSRRRGRRPSPIVAALALVALITGGCGTGIYQDWRNRYAPIEYESTSVNVGVGAGWFDDWFGPGFFDWFYDPGYYGYYDPGFYDPGFYDPGFYDPYGGWFPPWDFF